MQEELRLEWGHPILTPEGVEIRIPQFAFPRLRQLGLLQRNRNRGLYQISSMIYELMRSEYDCLTGMLRQILGPDLSGPQAWLECDCKDCKRDRSQLLRDLVPEWKQLIDRGRPGLQEF